jgi:hypothetical protein
MQTEQEKVTDLLVLNRKIITFGQIGTMYHKCTELMEQLNTSILLMMVVLTIRFKSES